MKLTLSILSAIFTTAAIAQSPSGAVLIYNPGSSVKLEQIIGDCDWQYLDWSSGKGSCHPTASQTATRFHVLGNGGGYTFEDNGKFVYVSGDTLSTDENIYKFRAGDAIGYSTTADGESPLLLNYYTDGAGLPLLVCQKCSGIATAGDDIPNSGISLPDGVYLVFSTGTDQSLRDPHGNDYSVLVTFDEKATDSTAAFAAGRTISRLTNGGGGHFIFTSLHTMGSDVYMFGVGDYRNSDIFLSKTPIASFRTGAGTQYFAGIVNGQPTWTNSESAAVPVVQDNPLNGPAWPKDSPTVGKMSVAYSSDLNLWLMTYDGGRQTNPTTGIYFTYATQPWGPWSAPQFIYNDKRDGGRGVYIHDPSITPDPPGDGLNGPVGQSADPYMRTGEAAGPLMIERFTRVSGNTLKIYWVMSTWNPYTVIKMRSTFSISRGEPVISQVANAEGESSTIAPNTWVEIKGANLAPASDSRIWQGSDFSSGQMPTKLDGVSATVNGKSSYVYYISPAQVNILTPPDAMTGAVQVVLTNNGVPSASFAAQAQALSPSFFVFNDARHVAATHANGTLLGPTSLSAPGYTFTPAQPGETISLYANGFGPTSVAVTSGSTTQSGTLAPLPVVKIGGVNAAVQFAGLISPGLFQLNVVVPSNTPDGDQSITATYGGATTQAGALVPVQH
jgi:uncharacterized protein (TIGR03437 family)